MQDVTPPESWQRRRSESVTVGIEVEDEAGVGNIMTYPEFDPSKCRKCQISFSDDQDDLLSCVTCKVLFHAGCEEPELDWSPTEAFCCPVCFEAFLLTTRGKHMFTEHALLGSGHLRRFTDCFTNRDMPYPSRGAAKWPGVDRVWEEPFTVAEFPLKVGQCVALRAEPRANDPRMEWPAVIRHVYFHRSGYPMFLVAWLEPVVPEALAPIELPLSHQVCSSHQPPTIVDCSVEWWAWGSNRLFRQFWANFF